VLAVFLESRLRRVSLLTPFHCINCTSYHLDPIPHTPEYHTDQPGIAQHTDAMSDPDPLLDPSNDPESTDTEAVQNLITALRATLTTSQTLLSTQAARLSHLADIETELAKLKDEHAFIAAAKEAADAKLKEEVKKREVAEETVEALRGQVESARRGVMTLQKQEKERKRMSTTGGLGALGIRQGEEEEILKDLASAGTGNKDKAWRSSAATKSHRRISSQSEPDGMYASSALLVSPNQLSTPVMGQSISQPSRGGLRELRLGAGNSVTSPPHISSTSPLPTISQEDTPVSPINDPSFMSTTSNEETIRLRNEVSTLQIQLEQAEEAREASENCLKALREFIAASPGGGGADTSDGQLDLTSADLVGIRLPPLPTDKDPDEPPTPPAKEDKKPMTGWGGLGKLWKGQEKTATMSPHSTAVEPSTPGLLSPGPSIRSLPQRGGSPSSTISQLPTAQEPIEEKVNALPTSGTSLANFVSGWTKTVAPGTPSAAPESRPLATRGFSGLWGRKKEDKDKDLPSAPEESEERQDTGLEPSPHIDEEHHEPDGVTVIKGKVEFDAGDASDHVETTPKQSGNKDLPDTNLEEASTRSEDGSTVPKEELEEKEDAGLAR
jgi:hypothetical protein